MKATQLRLGNIVGLKGDPLKIDHVLMLEPGLIHLESGSDYEQEEHIREIPIRAHVLDHYGIPANNWFYLGGIRMYIGLLTGIRDVQLHIDKHLFTVRSMHELQNLIHDHSGQDLIVLPHIHHPYGQE